MQQMRETVEPLMNAAWSEIAKPEAEEANVVRLFDEAGQTRRSFMRELTPITLSFLATLSPEQRAKFVELIRQKPWGHDHDPPRRATYRPVFSRSAATMFRSRNVAKDQIADHGRRDFLRFAASGIVAFAIGQWPAVFAQTGGASPLKIGMIGAGREGGALGTLLVKAGHPVMFSSRHPES